MAKNDLTQRVTKREQNWYRRGWEYRDVTGPDGTVRRRMVYTREYYRLGAARPGRLKALAALMYLALCAVYIGFETTLTQGGFVWYAGGPCLLAVIPLFYLGLGVWNLVRAEPYFTYRRMRAAFYRLRIGGRAACVLLGLGALGQLVFVLIYRRVLLLGPELFMLLGAAACAALAAALVVTAKRARCTEVSRKEYPGEKEGND